jgi:hypothetical protein
MNVSSDPPIVLLFYASKDISWAEKCRKQLGVFKVQGIVALWDKSTVPLGSVRQGELEQALAFAKVAILLVSADFLVECVAQLECILRCQQNRPDFWVCPVIVSACPYEQSPLCEFHPYWSAGNTMKEPLHNLPLFKQNESFCELARLIIQQLSKVPSSEENECPKEPAYITTEDKERFLQVRAILEKEGLPNHTFHSQYNNGEYLRVLQDIILDPNPKQELVKWVRDAMKIIIEDDKRVSARRNRSA